MDPRFLKHITQEISASYPISLAELIQEASDLHNVYVVVVDILQGFCEAGPLATGRVNEVVEPVTTLLMALRDLGLPSRNLIFLNDAHGENAVEFSAFPPHCVRGSTEAEVVQALQAFQREDGVQTFNKNATNGLFGKNHNGVYFYEMLEKVFISGETHFIVVGDCTDLCIYQNAMGIRLFANEKDVSTQVIVSQAHTRTYHLSIEDAQKAGALAHDADIMELMFLYHMKLNGIKIVSDIQILEE